MSPNRRLFPTLKTDPFLGPFFLFFGSLLDQISTPQIGLPIFPHVSKRYQKLKLLATFSRPLTKIYLNKGTPQGTPRIPKKRSPKDPSRGLVWRPLLYRVVACFQQRFLSKCCTSPLIITKKQKSGRFFMGGVVYEVLGRLL